MNRGTVMEVGSKNTVILTPDGQFVNIKKQPHHRVGEETVFSTGTHKRIRRHWLASGLSAAALLILFLGLWNFRTPPVVAYVTMDINPSVELGLDAKERVREMRAVNDDAQFIVQDLDYSGRDLESVMSEIAGKLVSKNLLAPADGQIVIASVPVTKLDNNWETNVTYKMKQVLLDAAKVENEQAVKSLHITTVSLPAEVREEAEVNGVSSGKMAFWLKAESQGHQLSIETLKNESLKNIAVSWGGVDAVMSDHTEHKEDKEKWKKLLKDIKKNKQLPAAKHESPEPRAQEDAAASKEPQQSQKPGAADKPNKSDNSKHSGKWEADGKPGQSDYAGRSGEAGDDRKEDKPQDRSPGSNGKPVNDDGKVNDQDKQNLEDHGKKSGKLNKEDRNNNRKRGVNSGKNDNEDDEHKDWHDDD